VTVSAGLFTVPSLTTSCTTKSPGTSAVNVGVTVVGPAMVAALPTGRLTKLHVYVSVEFSGSLEPFPFN